jgi:hypothetical protein
MDKVLIIVWKGKNKRLVVHTLAIHSSSSLSSWRNKDDRSHGQHFSRNTAVSKFSLSTSLIYNNITSTNVNVTSAGRAKEMADIC